MRNALIVQGGWEGHSPVLVSEVFKKILVNEGFHVEISDTLDAYLDAEKLKALHLIVPVWTMAKITKEQVENVSEAVASGVGLAGCHGGMCDSFRDSTVWQHITGGQWIAHPGNDGVEFTVNIKNSSSALTEGIEDFKVKTEHYYLHIDPVVEVLATTNFPLVNGYHATNKNVEMPVVWTKRWGHGRVYYNSLGHKADIFDIKEASELMRRGFLWAADGKDIAVKNNLSVDVFKPAKKEA